MGGELIADGAGRNQRSSAKVCSQSTLLGRTVPFLTLISITVTPFWLSPSAMRQEVDADPGGLGSRICNRAWGRPRMVVNPSKVRCGRSTSASSGFASTVGDFSRNAFSRAMVSNGLDGPVALAMWVAARVQVEKRIRWLRFTVMGTPLGKNGFEFQMLLRVESNPAQVQKPVRRNPFCASRWELFTRKTIAENHGFGRLVVCAAICRVFSAGCGCWRAVPPVCRNGQPQPPRDLNSGWMPCGESH